MKIIIETIQKAFSENLEAVFLLIVVTALLYLINIVLGTILGTFNIGFNLKKFLFGFLKGLIASLCIFAFCYALNLLALTLKLVDIVVSVDVLTVLEVIVVLSTWAIDLSKEIFEKVKSLKELKYIKYEDVSVNDYATDERG